MKLSSSLPGAVAFTLGYLIASPVLLAQRGEVSSPTNVWAAQTELKTITLVWARQPGAEGYRVYPAGRTPSRGIPTGELAKNVDRLVLPVVPRFTGSYSYEVAALYPRGIVSKKIQSNIVVPVTEKPPGDISAPGSVTATQTGPETITVTWSRVPQATAYVIGRAVTPGGLGKLCELCSTATNYVDRKVIAGVKHRYSVLALTPLGPTKRTMSNEVTPTGGKETVAGGDASPKGLSDLKATVVSPTSVQLSWLPSSGFTSFRINRKVGAGLTPSQLIAILAGTVFSFLDHLPAGSLGGGISYEIEAVDAKGSAQKATVAIAPEKAATDSAVSTPSPKGPSGLKATVISPTLVRLTWSPGLVGGMYQVMRQAKGATQVIATLPGSVSNFLDHFPPGGVPGLIGYWIEAVDGKGASERITVSMDPDKGLDEGEIDSLPRPRGRP